MSCGMRVFVPLPVVVVTAVPQENKTLMASDASLRTGCFSEASTHFPQNPAQSRLPRGESPTLATEGLLAPRPLLTRLVVFSHRLFANDIWVSLHYYANTVYTERFTPPSLSAVLEIARVWEKSRVTYTYTCLITECKIEMFHKLKHHAIAFF